MGNTRKKKVICYTGIKGRKNGKHTVKNFIKITKQNTSKSNCNRMKKFKKKFGYGSECPKNGNMDGWMKFYGAEYETPENCNSVVKKSTYNKN